MATLGNILARKGGTAITGREVTFKVLRRDIEQRVYVDEARAILFPVTADRESEVLKQAADAVKNDLRVEQQVQVAARFLAASMRDPDAVHRAFVADAEIERFIGCMTVDELSRLHREYQAYIADEYGLPTPAADQRTLEQALGFSQPDPARP